MQTNPLAAALESIELGPAVIVQNLTMMARQFLAVTAKAPQHVTPALGLGEDRRLTAPHMAGAALGIDEHVVHPSAFAL